MSLDRMPITVAMAAEQTPPTDTPTWLKISVPDDAEADAELLGRVRLLATRLPDSLAELRKLLGECRHDARFIPTANLANGLVWANRGQCFNSARQDDRLELMTYAAAFMPQQAQGRIFRRLILDPSRKVARAVAKQARRGRIKEVALPENADGDWDPSGWVRKGRGLSYFKQGRAAQEQHNVPPIANIGDLRERLRIVSTRQLGWMVSATDQRTGGPYRSFAIAKRDGSDRIICAPNTQLRYVQRRILDQILSVQPIHDAAHGFVTGRSIVTNAEPHIGARLILKVDLRNFFPTIHWTRVLGLFTSLGYYSGNCKLSVDDRSRNVAVVLARLCTYTPLPHSWQRCHTPQGAPTSPAIANLVCRKLDARLAGLSKRMSAIYTRYADDLTFSFRDARIDVGRFRWWVDQICHQEGFFVNHRKLRVVRDSRRQIVTGLVVNDCLRVPRETRRRLRAILHNCRTKGIESQSHGRSDFESYLRGIASYIQMVHAEEGRALVAQVNDLFGSET